MRLWSISAQTKVFTLKILESSVRRLPSSSGPNRKDKQFFPLSTAKSTGLYISWMQRWKGGEKKTDSLGTLGSKEQSGGELSRFSFYFIYPILTAGEACN